MYRWGVKTANHPPMERCEVKTDSDLCNNFPGCGRIVARKRCQFLPQTAGLKRIQDDSNGRVFSKRENPMMAAFKPASFLPAASTFDSPPPVLWRWVPAI